MKILHVINGWPISGGLQQIHSLILGTKEKITHFSIGNGQYGYDYVPILAKDGIECILSDYKYSNLLEIVKEHNIDIVHKQTGGGDCPLYVKTLFENKIPLIETLHCPRVSAIPQEMVNKVHAHFEYTRFINPNEVVVIPFPVNVDIGVPKIAERENRKFCIGRIARYEQTKMSHVIVEIAHYIYNKYPEYRDKFIFKIDGLVSSAYDEYYYNRLKAGEIKDFLEVNKNIGVDVKMAALDEYDIYVNPTLNEANYSFIEPLARGIPVIGNDCPMCKDIYMSIRLNECDVKAFAEAIIYYYKNKVEYMQESKKCIEVFSQSDYKPANHCAAMLKLYEEIYESVR